MSRPWPPKTLPPHVALGRIFVLWILVGLEVFVFVVGMELARKDQHKDTAQYLASPISLILITAVCLLFWIMAMQVCSLWAGIHQRLRPIVFKNARCSTLDTNPAFPARARGTRQLADGRVRIRARHIYPLGFIGGGILCGVIAIGNAGLLMSETDIWAKVWVFTMEFGVLCFWGYTVRRNLFRQRVWVELQKEPVQCGERTQALLRLGPDSALRHLTVTLTCFEFTRDRGISDEMVLFSEAILATTLPASTGPESTVPFMITIPLEKPPSLALRDDGLTSGRCGRKDMTVRAGIRWQMMIAMQHEGQSALEKVVPFRVAPGDPEMRRRQEMKAILAQRFGAGGLELELLSDASPSDLPDSTEASPKLEAHGDEVHGLRLQLLVDQSERGDKYYALEEEVRGFVKLTNRRGAWTPRYVDVVAWYLRSGPDKLQRQQRTIGAVANLVASDREVVFGAEQILPFSLRLPAFPSSYKGTSCLVSWYVSVYARGKKRTGPAECTIWIDIR